MMKRNKQAYFNLVVAHNNEKLLFFLLEPEEKIESIKNEKPVMETKKSYENYLNATIELEKKYRIIKEIEVEITEKEIREI